jgi:hypothetical protein
MSKQWPVPVPELQHLIDEQFNKIGIGILFDTIESIIIEATKYFSYSETIANDFSITLKGPLILFGKTNRLEWSAKKGFIADAAYSSYEFIENYITIGPNPG